jgi:hypothetical protein
LANRHLTNRYFPSRYFCQQTIYQQTFGQKTIGQKDIWQEQYLVDMSSILSFGHQQWSTSSFAHCVSVDKMAVGQRVLDQKTSNHITGRIAEKNAQALMM